MNSDPSLNDCAKAIKHVLRDISPNNSGRTLQKYLEDNPIFQEAFNLALDPGVSILQWASSSNEKMLHLNAIAEIQQQSDTEAMGLFHQYVKLKEGANSSRDTKEVSNFHM
jgi:hypothetical protein